MEGHCQCGQIRFTTPLPAPLALYICHCTECRHQSSSTYGMTAIFPYFEIKPPYEGAIAVYSRPNSNGHTDGFFCTKCGSRLIHVDVSPDGKPKTKLSVKSGCLDGITKEMMRKAVHCWTKSAVMDIPMSAEAFEEEPPGGSFESD
ncbi:uncharacterized protein A1O9_10720 [Exophiala aquamarina CBS 119918]|uniref:CENP-V/GFA domain-containing protein n=1 Tax=Exophiala aquamarina CBS 119918 TaxID=1182545 RepID=A0A072P0T9_9EURO|nr:uncharacterized protein A1O9_10720 [Exophiala aquamarina CBS 119918]KEF53272.1 hypothetical protein A1O9_10720 [Exophiala aquamarina CBS 119918]